MVAPDLSEKDIKLFVDDVMNFMNFDQQYRLLTDEQLMSRVMKYATKISAMPVNFTFRG